MIRIVIADDHAIVRAGLKQLICDEPDMIVAHEASSGPGVIALVRSYDCDVVLLDVVMPDTDSKDTLQIRRALPLVILSGYPARQYPLALIHAGANGYVQKEATAEQLIVAIRAVAEGRKYVSPGVADVLLAEQKRDPD